MMTSQTMPAPADALVLTLRRGGTLADWSRKGSLDRERLWLAALCEVYTRVILVTHGDASEAQFAAGLADIDRLCIIPTRASDTPPATHVREVLPTGASSVIVQSVHADDGGIGASIATRLRNDGLEAAYILRCSYLPSRRAACNGEPHLPEAIASGVLEFEAFRNADLVVGVSKSILCDLTWRYAFDPHRTRVIPNFVPIGDDAEVISPMDRPPGDLIAVGGINRSQRHDLTIDAIGTLDETTRSGITFTIVGDGPDIAAIRRLASERDVNLHIIKTLDYNDLLTRLGRATALVHAAPVGPQPRPILEAMALGTPVIANLSGAPLELLCNGVTGLAVPGEVDALASAFVGLLPDLDWRELLGSSAARQVRTTCGIDQVRNLTVKAHRAAMDYRYARAAA